MPAMLESLSHKIMEAQMKKGMSKKKAKSAGYAIATSALQKNGYMKKGSQELTKKGQNYQVTKVEKK